MSDAEMNVGTPEAASSSETLFGGENDYAAMYNMICGQLPRRRSPVSRA
jgi:hypothetical protein